MTIESICVCVEDSLINSWYKNKLKYDNAALKENKKLQNLYKKPLKAVLRDWPQEIIK
jgi:hypothetical protein